MECSREKAAEIAQAGHKDLMVLFSGGVDCTLAALSLLDTGKCEHLVIGASETAFASTDPALMDWFRNRGIEVRPVNGFVMHDYVKAGGHFVTGCFGDSILLSDYIHDFNATETIWDMTLEQLFESMSGFNSVKGLIEKNQYFIDAMPDHLERSAANVVWWTEFCLDWHTIQYNLTSRVQLGAPGVTHSHFFNTTPFQRWAQQDASLKVGKDAATHKRAYYDACHQLAGFKFKTPVKTRGFENLYVDNYDPLYHSRIIAITDDWKVIQKGAHACPTQ
jgi:hypothetical protein